MELIGIGIIFFLGFALGGGLRNRDEEISLEQVAWWMHLSVLACGGNIHNVRALYKNDLNENVFMREEIEKMSIKERSTHEQMNLIKRTYLTLTDRYLQGKGNTICRYLRGKGGKNVNYDAWKIHPKEANFDYVSNFYKHEDI